MSLDVWISFVGACFILCIIPGPTMLMVMVQALNHGKRSVIPLIAGTMAGNVFSISVAIIGMSAVMATSTLLFEAMKWMGAGYLFYLGIRFMLMPVETLTATPKPMVKGRVFRDVFIVTALNPKSIIFFVVLYPLFFDENKAVITQVMVMAISLISVSVVAVAMYGLCSGYIHGKLHSNSLIKWFNITSGSLLIGAGAFTAMLQEF